MKDFLKNHKVYIPIYNLKYILDTQDMATDDIIIVLSVTNGMFFGFFSLLF